MIKLWGRLSSINVQKVLWALEELGLAYERIDAGGAFGINDTPEYRAMNPNGLVPTIDDDGFVLWESNAIVRYLAAKSGEGPLWPADPARRASADRWMDWQNTEFSPSMRDVFVHLVRTPAERRDPDAIARSLQAGERFAGIADRHLAERAYVAGDEFSVGDIAVGAAVHRWLNLPIEKQARPHLEHWYSGIRVRPAAAKALQLPLT